MRHFGWHGPTGGGPHMTMSKQNQLISVPNPHGSDIDWSLTKRILIKAGINPKEWDALG
jgi:hypothetical protein